MKDLSVLGQKEVKMTSLDLAEITGKDHKQVMKEIRNEIENLRDVLAGEIFSLGYYTDKNNQKRPCYEFGKKGAMQLALKYNAVTRYRVIEKIEELEKQNDLPKNFAEALRLAADQAEIIEAQKQVISEVQPKADYVDRILNSKDLLTITQIAKDYGLSGNKLNTILHKQGVQYKQSRQWLLYQNHADKGYTQSKTVEFKDKAGNNRFALNTKWTTKGRLFIHDILTGLGIYPNLEFTD